MAEIKGQGRRRGVAALVAVLALGLMGLVYRFAIPSAWPVVTLEPREMVQSVVATATVQTRHRANVGVQLAGTVREVGVVEGERFRQGQVLLRLDDREARAAMQAAELAVRQAELKWQQWRDVQAPVAREADRQAQANLVQARAQFERQQDLFQQGFVGQAALDEALRAWRVAQAQAGSAAAQGQAHVEGGIEQALSRSALVQAQANLAAAQARLSYTEVRASFDGQVISRAVEPGDTVQPGKTLLALAPDGVTELVAQIDERNLALLKLGQTAQASADAYPGQKFPAVISSIAPGVDPQRGAVQVKLQVQAPPAYLRQDMTISVEVEVARQVAALALPTDAVHDLDAPRPWVWGLDAQGRVQRAELRLGLRAGTRVQVLEGLAPGARVVAVQAPELTAGTRVRASQP